LFLSAQIVEIAGEEGKGSTLGITLLLGSFCSLFCSPFPILVFTLSGVAAPL
jgi:hypothetical protein